MFTPRVLKAWASVALVVTLATFYTRHHLSKFERKDWGQELYIEDSKAGGWLGQQGAARGPSYIALAAPSSGAARRVQRTGRSARGTRCSPSGGPAAPRRSGFE